MSAVQETTEPTRLETFLTYRMHRVNKLSDKDTHRAYMEECGLPLGEARCLAAIGRFEPLSVNDLARAANLNKGNASRSAQALVDSGLVCKQISELDGRSVVLSTTSAGKIRYREVIALIDRRNEQIFGCLSRQEQAQLAGMLDRIIAAHHASETGSD